jgi:hypothetical protein
MLAHPFDECQRLLRRLGAEDRQQQVALGEAVGLGPVEAGGQRVDQLAEVPPLPVRRVDDHLDVERAVA